MKSVTFLIYLAALSASFVITSASGCILTEGFSDHAATRADAAHDARSARDVAGTDTTATDVSATDVSATDAGDASAPDVADSGNTEADAPSCSDPCQLEQQFLCGERVDGCNQNVLCTCPEGFVCGADGRLCDLRPDTEITRCDNGIDDDGDNLTDCADSDCFPKRNTDHACWNQTYHVFVTRDDTRGSIEPVVAPGTTPLIGAEAADRQCQNEAGAIQLGSDWKAIISTKSESAASRLSIQPAPILNMRGELVATSAAGLWDGAIDHAIKYDQLGDDVSQLGNTNIYVWTGTRSDGTSSGSDCNGWTSGFDSADGSFGILVANNGSWVSSASPGSCDQRRHLYCINRQAP
jgi:hypothetical protein